MPKKPLFIDGHQDLAWNMLTFQRDYTKPLAELRAAEKGTYIPQWNGETILGWDTYQKARAAIVFGTLFSSPIRHKEGEWDIMCYRNAEEAHTQYRQQIDAYEQLTEEHSDKFVRIFTNKDLDTHIQRWQQA
ncbi:MAG: hypothetical protein N2D54_08860, partial [Chloroflexota bacterium]